MNPRALWQRHYGSVLLGTEIETARNKSGLRSERALMVVVNSIGNKHQTLVIFNRKVRGHPYSTRPADDRERVACVCNGIVRGTRRVWPRSRL